MNRTDRLLALVLELRVRGTVRAEDLAHTFGTSKRTIYRDMQALSEAGVPIVAVLGEGYQLGEGYFLPPLSFTADEATLILLGLDAIARSFDADYQRTGDDARRKIVGVLSETTRERVEMLQSSLLLGNLQRVPPAEQEALRVLRRAILTSQTVRFRYFSRHPGGGRVSQRHADPYALACLDGVWYMNAYCHLRQDRRLFRLSRMEDLTLTARRFQRPADFRLSDSRDHDDRTLIVRLLFDEDVQPWIMEERYYYIEQREPHPNGVLVTLRVRHIDEIFQWVFGWGRHVRVLEPPALAERIREEARTLLES